MTMSMFPDEYPDETWHERPVVHMDYVQRTPEWVLLRAKGTRMGDVPKWHRRRYESNVGVIAACGYLGTKVTEEVPNGASILPCRSCVESGEKI